MDVTINRKTIELVRGDITDQDTDAIVNPANERLVLGGGVAGAIRRKGGPSIQQQCNRIGGTAVGTAVITGAGQLRARYVIHAVGPRMGEGQEQAKLAGATLSSLQLADRHHLASVALPAIGTGIFGLPMDLCAKVMVRTVLDYVRSGTCRLQRIVFVLFDPAAMEVFSRELTEQTRGLSSEA